MNHSRRKFLQASGGLVAAAAGPLGHGFNVPLAMSLAGLGAMAAQQADAADMSEPYKALVCLYMNGGSDSHNWVVPTDTSGYSEYAAARTSLAWPSTKLMPLSATNQGSGRTFGMPLELQPLHALYEAGQCAILANVGPLVRPTTKAEFMKGTNLPSKLFSHNDQQSTWQSLSPEGARSGWGGRMGDVLMAANQYPVFTAVSASGNAVFLAGSKVTQYQVATTGPVTIAALSNQSLQGSTTSSAALRQVLLQAGSSSLQSEYVRVMQRSIETSATLQSALSSVSVPALPTAPVILPNGSTLAMSQDPLANQLRAVAQLIAAAPRLGMRRQVFMVAVNGFDSHANQMRDQPTMMARVANAVSWFTSSLAGLGMQNNVTLFTASDFGRTLTSNGVGCDHGWGSHHFVIGGAVKGRSIFGSFPITALGTENDMGSGRLLPTTSVTEYAATLGTWMGLSSSELGVVLPGLSNFQNPALGFL